MAKEEIKKLLQSSKNELDKDQMNFTESIRNDLQSFKKKTLDQI